MDGSEFDGVMIGRLASKGVVSGAGSNGTHFNLERGKVLFAPKKDITVQTHEGKVLIAAALANVKTLKQPYASQTRAQRNLHAKMMKHAVIISIVSDNRTPYKMATRAPSEH